MKKNKKNNSTPSLVYSLQRIKKQIDSSIDDCRAKIENSLKEIIKLIPKDIWPDMIKVTEFITIDDNRGKSVCASNVDLIKAIFIAKIGKKIILLTPEGLLETCVANAFYSTGSGNKCTIEKFKNRQMQLAFNTHSDHLPFIEKGKDYKASMSVIFDYLPVIIEAVTKLITSRRN